MSDIHDMHNSHDDDLYLAWMEAQMNRIAKRKFYKPRNEHATIDSNGYRHVWSVTNNKGRVQFFDSSKGAIDLARDSVNQPCHIQQHPILPCGFGWNLDIAQLGELIKKAWSQGG